MELEIKTVDKNVRTDYECVKGIDENIKSY